MSEINEKHILTSVLTKVFGKTEDEINEILYTKGDDDELVLNEAADDVFITMDAERIKRTRDEIGKNNEKKFNDFAKKTKAEVLTKLEGELKQQYGIDSDKTGVELIAEIVESSKDSGVEITEESLKTNPIFLKLEKGIREDLQSKLDELDSEFNTYKGSVAKDKKMSTIRSRAKSELLSLNPVLSENQAVADNQVADFMARIDGYDYDEVDGDIIILVNGERLEDGHGHPKTFESFVKEEAGKRFDFAAQQQRQSSGNKTGADANAGKKKISRKEYNDLMAKAQTDQEIYDIGQNYVVED